MQRSGTRPVTRAAKEKARQREYADKLGKQLLVALSPEGGVVEKKERAGRRKLIKNYGGLLTLRNGKLGMQFYDQAPMETNTHLGGYGLGHRRGARMRQNDGNLVNVAGYMPQTGALKKYSQLANAMHAQRQRAKALRQRRIARQYGGTSAKKFANTTYLFREPMTPREKLVKRIEKRIALAMANPQTRPLKLRTRGPGTWNGTTGGTPYYSVSPSTYRSELLKRYNSGRGPAKKVGRGQRAYFRMVKDAYTARKRLRQPVPDQIKLAYKIMLRMKRAKALAKKKAKVNGGSPPVARRTRATTAATATFTAKKYKDLAKRQATRRRTRVSNPKWRESASGTWRKYKDLAKRQATRSSAAA